MNKTLLVAAGLGVAALTLRAQTFQFDITGPAANQLDPGNVVPNPGNPSPTSSAFGTEFNAWSQNGGIYLDTAGDTLDFHADVFQFSGSGPSAQLRGPADTTANSPTVISSIVVNDVGSGHLQLDLTGLSLSPSQVNNLKAGNFYVQLNSDSYPEGANGELRGQLTPVPEPQSYALAFGLALLGFAGYRRFKTGAA